MAFESALTALLVSSSEKLQRLVRRVLSDLEIQVVSCPDGETAIQKVTRQRFEAVLVDFGDSVAADQVIRGLQLAPGNKRAIVVAFVDPEVPLKSAFARGAHFVLHKSLSAERTKSSFRAVRALMKRERRRNQRVPVEMSVKCDWLDKSAMTCQSSDRRPQPVWCSFRSLCHKRSMRSKSEPKSRGAIRRAWWECGLPIFRLRQGSN